jgi:hypothetical protein
MRRHQITTPIGLSLQPVDIDQRICCKSKTEVGNIPIPVLAKSHHHRSHGTQIANQRRHVVNTVTQIHTAAKTKNILKRPAMNADILRSRDVTKRPFQISRMIPYQYRENSLSTVSTGKAAMGIGGIDVQRSKAGAPERIGII